MCRCATNDIMTKLGKKIMRTHRKNACCNESVAIRWYQIQMDMQSNGRQLVRAKYEAQHLKYEISKFQLVANDNNDRKLHVIYEAPHHQLIRHCFALFSFSSFRSFAVVSLSSLYNSVHCMVWRINSVFVLWVSFCDAFCWSVAVRRIHSSAPALAILDNDTTILPIWHSPVWKKQNMF